MKHNTEVGYDPALPDGDESRVVLRFPDGQMKAFISEDELHHQLQKARHDWLREEIVRLQDQQGRWVAGYAPATNGDDPSKWGFRTEQQAWDYIKKTHLCKPNCEACEAEWMVYTEPNTDQALQTIIDRYQAELDQDKK